MSIRKHILEDLHKSLGATFGEFAGWSVPMSYEGTLKEHMAVRREAGIFDISHMGRMVVKGEGATELLERIYTKRVSKTKVGFMSGPTLALNEYARVKDDEMPYRLGEDEWLIVPNAAVADAMLEYFRGVASNMGINISITDLRDRYALLALQGPRSTEVMERLGGGDLLDLKPLQFKENVSIAGATAYIVSRSGWTGEDGFEIIAEVEEAKKIFRAAVEAGAKPAGIAARDTLRIEAGFVLGGHEYGEDPLRWPCAVSLRYGLGAIDWGKKGFIGEAALRACRREGVRWIRVGLVMKKKYARMIPRTGYRLYIDDVDVGWVTSGTFSPVIERGVAQAYIDTRYAYTGDTIEVDVRGRRGEARLQEFPLVPLGSRG
ncbi:glycine cleavage system aminomethyltransferase GcvT [Aeropyrum camini]|uniref:aminomethyltransferase n=1 Tax=Aeropyrum camini SY1 = JCM 12091 TaxID=1198449 RepID=U3TES1_9CREN|nr:glycine cleavage system aminomethyltransferase GcvT [Aeropyrum camini]BAN90530.1 glycine cleavage system aminomethyltransferase [Aeropyrum camini SY1 = JCM 12091]